MKKAGLSPKSKSGVQTSSSARVAAAGRSNRWPCKDMVYGTIAFEVAFLVPILPPFAVGGHATGSEPTALGRRSCLPRSLVFSSRSVRVVTARLSKKSTVNHDTEPSTAVKLKPTRTTVATLITIKIVTKARPKPVGSEPCTFDLWLLRIFLSFFPFFLSRRRYLCRYQIRHAAQIKDGLRLHPRPLSGQPSQRSPNHDFLNRKGFSHGEEKECCQRLQELG